MVLSLQSLTEFISALKSLPPINLHVAGNMIVPILFVLTPHNKSKHK